LDFKLERREKKMNIRLLFFVALFIGGLVAVSFATGDVEKGKALFNDPKLGGSENASSCNSCHPDGKGLEGVTEKKDMDTLEATINQCITMSLKGKPLPIDSQEMQDIIAYLQSLK
jgi:cytochrome c